MANNMYSIGAYYLTAWCLHGKVWSGYIMRVTAKCKLGQASRDVDVMNHKLGMRDTILNM